MKKPDIDGIDPDVQCYIDYLENIVNAHPKFQQELSRTLDVLADDLRLANSGATEGFKILSVNKDDKIFERIVTLLKMKTEIKAATLAENEGSVKKKPTKMQDLVLVKK